MTLREAIEHCEELAESCEGSLCGEQHKQLAEWLRNYERLKKLPYIAVDKDGNMLIAERLLPIPPLACEGNANGWTMYDEDDDMNIDPPLYENVLVQYWDDTVGIDCYLASGSWFHKDKPIACWRPLP